MQMVLEGQHKRGYATISVGIAGAQNLWGLRVSHDGAVRNVSKGSVAATSLVRPQVRYSVTELRSHTNKIVTLLRPTAGTATNQHQRVPCHGIRWVAARR